MALPKVSIVILNWNNWKDTIETVESIFKINYSNYEVILVDNGSTNDSVDQIKRYFNDIAGEILDSSISTLNGQMVGLDLKRLHSPTNKSNVFLLLWTKENQGFSEGNNFGIRFCCKNSDPDYILLLNNDVIVDSNFLNELIDAAEKMPNIGFLGPKIYYYDYEGRKDVISFAGGDMNFKRGTFITYGLDQLDKGQADDKKIVDWVQGSCILAKKEVLADIGLLDPMYFFYWEDTDWCIRGKKSGWTSLYVPASKIWHKGGMSSIGTKNTFPIYFFSRNRLIFMRKNSNPMQFTIFLIYFFGLEFWYLVIYYSLYGNVVSLKTFLNATVDGLKTKIDVNSKKNLSDGNPKI